MLEGSKSHFVVDDLQQIQTRLDDRDLHLTGPLCGRGRAIVTQQALQWESEILSQYSDVLERLDHMGLSQDRRALRVFPKKLSSVCESAGVWRLSFELPPGSFATSVLRELCDYSLAARSAGEHQSLQSVSAN